MNVVTDAQIARARRMIDVMKRSLPADTSIEDVLVEADGQLVFIMKSGRKIAFAVSEFLRLYFRPD